MPLATNANLFLLWLPRDPTARENSKGKIVGQHFQKKQFQSIFSQFQAISINFGFFHFLTKFFSNTSFGPSCSIWGSPRGKAQVQCKLSTNEKPQSIAHKCSRPISYRTKIPVSDRAHREDTHNWCTLCFSSFTKLNLKKHKEDTLLNYLRQLFETMPYRICFYKNGPLPKVTHTRQHLSTLFVKARKKRPNREKIKIVFHQFLT